MQDSSKGKMFLAAERGHSETEWFRSYATFNFGSHQSENKAAFGPLYLLNDNTLAPGKSTTLVAVEDACIVLLPVVGALTYKQDVENGMVQAGEIIVLPLAKSACIQLSNPFEAELINYIQLWFHSTVVKAAIPLLFPFDINEAKNQLINVFQANEIIYTFHLPAAISIGKFSGREEVVYNISKKENGLFVFVLQGAFEVQYRLLEARDGLALWDVRDVEIEALSNDAILLLVELPVS